MYEQIEDYLHFLTIERGLSLNTRLSYERDLKQYYTFVQTKQITSWQQIDRYTILAFLEQLKKENKSTATITRMISSLRRFNQFLRQEGIPIMIQCNTLIRPKKYKNCQIL